MLNCEDVVFYGQIDSYRAVKDYQKKGRCVRLLAVQEQQFSQSALESADGVQVISIEVSYWEFCRLAHGNGRVPTKSSRDAIDILDEDIEQRDRWYKLEVKWNSNRRHGYAYPTFGDDEPYYFELVSCSQLNQKLPLAPAPLFQDKKIILSERSDDLAFFSGPPDWSLSAFHVGQGMCSIISNGIEAILLDVGAGTPITRPLYQGKKFQNDLTKTIAGVKFIDLILSHADQDHWRILAWDSDLRNKIRHIYVPEGAKSLAFKDPAIKLDITEIKRLTISLSANSKIEVYRSKPKKMMTTATV